LNIAIARLELPSVNQTQDMLVFGQLLLPEQYPLACHDNVPLRIGRAGALVATGQPTSDQYSFHGAP
jgi:hypothetical protein